MENNKSKHRLRNMRLKLLKHLMEDTIIKKRTYKIVEKNIDGNKITTREFAGHRPINCQVKDWAKGDKHHRGDSARERIRLECQKIISICKEIRKLTFEIDKEGIDIKNSKGN